MRCKPKVAAMLLLLFVVISKSSMAFAVRDLTTKERFDKSQVVAIAVSVSGPRRLTLRGEEKTFVRMHTEVSLKGSAPEEFEFAVSSRSGELSIACCEKGARYITFMHKVDDQHYASILGYRGMYQLIPPRMASPTATPAQTAP